tara:strand:+ start:736 stop:1110 length:375 start_codon:yes stop_codon:yes gene_type:complete
MNSIDKRIYVRSLLAFRCLPFHISFYKEIQKKGLDSEVVFQSKNKYCVKGQNWFSYAQDIEESFCWLIKLGILRREVDGQGLTSKIRLTPLGRQILDKEPWIPSQKANFFEKIKYYFYRNFELR